MYCLKFDTDLREDGVGFPMNTRLFFNLLPYDSHVNILSFEAGSDSIFKLDLNIFGTLRSYQSDRMHVGSDFVCKLS